MKSNTKKKKKGLNVVMRHFILAVCSAIVLVCIASQLLGVITRHNQHIVVPEFVGTELSQALKTADAAKLEIHVNDSLYVPAYKGGVVLDQNPKAGSEVKSGRHVFVTVNSYKQRKVQLPYVTGYSLRQAKNILEVAGLEIDEIRYVPDIATNYVIEQRVGGNLVEEGTDQQVYVGSSVTLIVGQSEKDTVALAVPKVVGLSLAEAKSRLWERGLNIGSVRFDEGIDMFEQNEARVFVQSPGQAQLARLGQKVTLQLTLDAEKIEKQSVLSDREAKKLIEARMKAAADSLGLDSIIMEFDPSQEVYD
ncbi:MAG: PASTA domain-containing protein [Rikenellaceae bacterium]|nr:PASTA domain-containing protein [Rikenellaceae bacterium]